MTFLTEAEKRNIAQWQYNVTDKSVTTRLFTPLWEFWVKFVPDSVAPNVLTAAALLCQIQAFYICWLYGTMFPRVVSLVAMCLIVMYQTLDAIDGKHARNTRQSSPLGELFDHGCDNLGSVFMILALCFCLGIQSIPILWYLVQISQLLFLQSHVASFHSRKVEFGLLSGPGEILFIFEMILFIQFALPTTFMGFVYTYGHKLVTALVGALVSVGLPLESHPEWIEHFTDPLNLCRYCYGIVLAYSVVKALTLGHSKCWMRTGLILCYVFRAAPLVLVHISPLGNEYTLRDVVLDGLFMSVITSDVIVSKMANRELHPFVVLFAMVSLINPLTIVGIVSFYYVALFVEISEYMNIPIFSVSRNVYVDGVYDLCHIGHKKQFENALAMGNRLLVGVVSDANVYKYKQKYPVMTLAERAAEVRALRMVSEVIEDCPCPAPFEWRQSEGLPPTAPILDEAFIKKYRIHVVAHGEEYLPEKLAKGAMDYYAIPRAMGICRPLPRTPGISTSELMKRMKERVTEGDRILPAADDGPEENQKGNHAPVSNPEQKLTQTTESEKANQLQKQTKSEEPEKASEEQTKQKVSDTEVAKQNQTKSEKEDGDTSLSDPEVSEQQTKAKETSASEPVRRNPPRSAKRPPRI